MKPSKDKSIKASWIPIVFITIGLVVYVAINNQFTFFSSSGASDKVILNKLPDNILGNEIKIKWQYKKLGKNEDFKVFITKPDGEVFIDKTKNFVYIYDIRNKASGLYKVQVGVSNQPITNSTIILTEVYINSLDRITKTGKIRVAIHFDNNFQMFSYITTNYEGFDIDLAKLIAREFEKRFNIKDLIIKFIPYGGKDGWKRLIKELNSPSKYDFDFAIASISIPPSDTKWKKILFDPDRKNILFSDPYYETSIAGVYQSEKLSDYFVNQTSLSIESLSQLNIAVHEKTTAKIFAERVLGLKVDDDKLAIDKNNENLFYHFKNESKVQVVLYDYVRAIAEEAFSRNHLSVKKIEYTVDQFPKENYGIATTAVNKKLIDELNNVLKKYKGKIRENLEDRINSIKSIKSNKQVI